MPSIFTHNTMPRLCNKHYMITHLEVPVHNVMLVDVADALQDLVDAVTGGDREDKKKSRHTSVRCRIK